MRTYPKRLLDLGFRAFRRREATYLEILHAASRSASFSRAAAARRSAVAAPATPTRPPRRRPLDGAARPSRGSESAGANVRQCRQRGERPDVETRFWQYVDKGPPDGHDTCWIWLGGLTHNGYGKFWAHGTTHRAHRFAYTLDHPDFPKHLHLDHSCRNHRCVRPSHLDPVTNHVNTLRGHGPTAQNARKTHCDHGHALTPENCYPDGRASRRCRICSRRRAKARYHRLRKTA